MLKNWWIDSDNLLTIEGVKNLLTLAYVNDATVAMQLADADGTAVGAAVTLDYVAGSDGNYKGVLPRSVTTGLSNGIDYTGTISMIKDTSQADLDIVLRAGRRIFVRTQP